MQITRSETLDTIISEILKIQRQEYNVGNSDNVGASIDAMVVIDKLVSHNRYRGNVLAAEISEEIEKVYGDHLKYAKPLSKFTQTGAYHIVRKALA